MPLILQKKEAHCCTIKIMNLEKKFFQKNDSAVSSLIDNEVYILDMRSNKYLKLNETASFIWKILERKTDFYSLKSECEKKFTKFEESHLTDFLIEAEKKQLIQIHEV